MISKDNFYIHEIIGLDAKIIESTNTNFLGKKGTIIDETKSMFVLDSNKKQIMIPKKHNTWEFFINNEPVKIDGAILNKRPHDRLKIKQ